MSNLKNLFLTESIAIVGASNHSEKVGHQILRNLLAANPDLTLFPINPMSKTILGIPVFESLSTVKAGIDLVIIATPAPTVPALIDEIIERNRTRAAKEKTSAVIIVSAGFSEVGDKGKDIQHAIATKLALAKIQLLGPNTLGIINPHTKLNASFAQHHIPADNLAVISQSGAMLTALFDTLQDRQVGVSFAVSLGNKADINENDCLEYAEKDKNTTVIALYLESFTDLPHFFELTSRISKKKPIVVLKGGTSQRGQQASASHTAALATNQVLLHAATHQMGFTLVESIEELLDTSMFISMHRQIPENVMVITNAGGPAVNTVDLLEKSGVTLAQWSKKSQEDLNNLMPMIPAHNPLDILGDASPERYKLALHVAQHDLDIDSILLIATPQAMTDIAGIVDEVIASHGRKPILVAIIGGDHLEKFRHRLRQHHIFCTEFPEECVDTLAVSHRMKQAEYFPETFKPHISAAEKFAQKIAFRVVAAKKSTPPRLADAFYLLSKYGFRLPKYELITENALGDLEKIAYPVFAKTANLSLVHKQSIGAVYGLVHDADEARKAYTALKKFGNEVLFQEVMKIDLELLLGVQNDPQFGFFLTIGLGGSYTNVLADRSYAFLPTTKHHLREVWQETKAFAELQQNFPKLSEVVLENIIQLQKLLLENPWIKGLEINPLIVNEHGVWAADVKVT